MQTARLLTYFVIVAILAGCATIAGGLIGTGVGIATGHPVSGALIGTGVGIMIDTAPPTVRGAPAGTTSSNTR